MHKNADIESLYEQHYQRMLLTARTLLHDEEEARDIVSDVFTELLSKGKELNEPQAENYLIVCVRNKCMNLLKHQRVVKECTNILSPNDEDTNYEEPPYDEVLDYMDTQLSPKTQHIMSQHFLGKKKYNEIAQDMGISRIAVYKHLTSGLRQLRTHFAWYHLAILLILLSGMAFAIYIQFWRPAPSRSVPEPTTEQPSHSVAPAVIHYEDATLEQILSDIAIYNKVELRFLNEPPRTLRLYYDWHQSESVDDIIHTLDAFENIHVEYRQNTILVK